MHRQATRCSYLGAIAALSLGCAGSDPRADVVRLPDPVPIATSELAASAVSSAAPAAVEPHRPILPKRIHENEVDGDDDAPTGKAAADQDRARELFKEGVDAYAQGDFPKACAAFEAAYQLAPLQPLLFNIASCEMRMGHVPKACSLFHLYVQNGDPSDPRIVEVKQQVANRCP